MDNKTNNCQGYSDGKLLLSFLIITPQSMKARVDGVHRKGVTENKITQEGIISMVHYGTLHVSW